MKNNTANNGSMGMLVQEYASQQASQYMSRRIAPVLMVSEEKDFYDKLEIDEMTKITGTIEHADCSNFAEITYVHTTDSYQCRDYGLDSPIARAAEKRTKWSKRLKVAMALQRAVMVEEEFRSATQYFSATNFTGYTLNVAVSWDTFATAVPINNIAVANLQLVRQVGGVIDPDVERVLAMSEEVFTNLQQCAQIIAAQKGGTGSDGTDRPLASKTQMATILKVDAIETSAAQRNGVDIWDNEYALLFLRSRSAAAAGTPQMVGEGSGDPDEVQQLGRTLIWDKMAEEENQVTDRYEEGRDCDVVRVRQYQDEKALQWSAGVLMTNITA